MTTMHLAMVGATYREVGFERLGELIPTDDQLTALAGALGGAETVIVRSCNRLECYVAAPRPLPDLARRCAAYFEGRGVALAPDALLDLQGGPAAEHLFEVTSSLHSLVVGETEISGQVRRALETADALALSGPHLRGLFEQAVACSRRVRRETELGRLSVSVASLALQKVRKHFGEDGPRCAAVIGVGAMTRKVALTLGRERRGELLVVNRTLARAEALAAECGGRAMALDAFQQTAPAALELVFSATSSPVPVLRPETLAPALRAGRERPLIVCDLGIPRDSDPALDQTPGVTVITLPRMEQLAAANRSRLEGEVEHARAIVADEATRSLREQRFAALAETSVRGLLTQRLAHLDPADQETIARFAANLAQRMARQPH